MAPQGHGPRGIEREKQVAAEAAADLVENGKKRTDGPVRDLIAGTTQRSEAVHEIAATSRGSTDSSSSSWTHRTNLEATWLPRQFDCSSPMSTARW